MFYAYDQSTKYFTVCSDSHLLNFLCWTARGEPWSRRTTEGLTSDRFLPRAGNSCNFLDIRFIPNVSGLECDLSCISIFLNLWEWVMRGAWGVYLWRSWSKTREFGSSITWRFRLVVVLLGSPSSRMLSCRPDIFRENSNDPCSQTAQPVHW